AHGLCRSWREVREVREPMPPELQQQSRVRSMEHPTVPIRAQLAQRLSLSVCQLPSLVLVEESIQAALLGRRRAIPQDPPQLLIATIFHGLEFRPILGRYFFQ